MTRDRRCRLTLVATILGSTIVFLDQTVVTVALPALREDLDQGLAGQQWVVEGYLLTLATLILVGGSLGDRLGRRRIFLVGLVGFGITSLACALAPSGGFLIAERTLQGVAGALLVPSSLAIITATFDEEERGRAIGTWTAWTGIGIVIGPLVGGFLVDEFSWRWIFAINVPLILLVIVLTLKAVEESRDESVAGAVDVPGAFLCALGLGGMVYALTEQPTHGFSAAEVAVPLAAGAALFAAFLLYESRSRDPMLPLDLFRIRNFAVGNLATLTIYAGLYGASFFLSLFLQQVAGYSALEAGLSQMPITLILFVLSRATGGLAERHGPRFFMTAGPLLAGAGLLLLLRVDAAADYLADVLPGVMVFGFGVALTVAPLTAAVLGAPERRRAGIASGVNNAIARAAGLVAIAAVGAVVAAQFGSTLDDRLRGRPLDGAARPVLADARERPLVAGEADRLPERTRTIVGPAIEDASVDGFRLGMLVAALLVISGGVISGFGIQNRARPAAEGAPT